MERKNPVDFISAEVGASDDSKLSLDGLNDVNNQVVIGQGIDPVVLALKKTHNLKVRESPSMPGFVPNGIIMRRQIVCL